MPRPLPIVPITTRHRFNVVRHGFEQAAAHVLRVLDGTRGPHVVQVLDTGDVLVRPACKFEAVDLDALVVRPEYVGTFTRDAAPEVVEDVLIHRARELSAGVG